MKLRIVLAISIIFCWASWTFGSGLEGSGYTSQAENKSGQAGGTAKGITTIAEKTKGLESLPGYFPLYWDARSGKLWLEIDEWDKEFLYVESLPAGIGSNDIGLDRGQLGASRVVRFERSGPKVLLMEPNYEFRATTENAEERESVREAFAESTLWGFKVEAEEGDRVLVDATDFFLRDAHHVAQTLKRAKQGDYKLDASRSAFYLPRTRNFPQNTEVEATLTFVGENPGRWVRQVVPSPEAITVREHHSFVELPGPGYQPRVFDTRAGFFGMRYMDFASRVDERIVKRFITRHRLQKKDPSAAISDPVQPIIYYLDPGVPEPIRSALLEGAGWWNQAFEAAGYRNAFQVRMLPEGADPMDVRYNLIQWVHRSTRGWSYGGGVIDPRTGEIIKGMVTLDSSRLRQDYLIAEGLRAPYEKGKPASPALLDLALARVRQLAAHEVGHTLGLAHNFAASAQGNASVMDYPQPMIKLAADGNLDVSHAYATGIGAWDKVAIAYGYQDFPAGTDERKALDNILTSAAGRGLFFISDADARPPGSAHPTAHLWDNGPNAVDELARMMKVRAAALSRFGEDNIREDEPLNTLEEVLVPIYMLHRYQVEAAAKVLGGLDYRYAVRGDGQIITKMIPPQEERRALDALLSTIKPDALVLPQRVLDLIPPPPEGYPRTRETFAGRTGLTFDALGPAEAVASLTVGLILNPERDTRLMEHHALDSQSPDLVEVIDRLIESTWKSGPASGYKAATQQVVDNTVLFDLMSLAANENAAAQVRAVASLKLTELKDWMSGQAKNKIKESRRAQLTFAIVQIERFQKDSKQLNLTKPPEPPPGQPIGDDVDFEFLNWNPGAE
ncbi:MAG TPA: zinc-dependent metalloprotease [Terriglobia bacterium]|nr:zinc-dependent metalloprotease [Terriglobia bacterium]